MGGGGSDTIFGGQHDDSISGGHGHDEIYGGAGDDKLWGDQGNDVLHGGDGDDFIVGHGGHDELYGGGDDDTLQGGSGDDTLDGGSENDDLWGGTGSDTLIGGAGDDRLAGGDGADTFVFAAGHGNDTITDFAPGEDCIDLSTFTDIQSFDDLDMSLNNRSTVIDLTEHGGGTIKLQGVSPNELDADDFEFAPRTSYVGTDEGETLTGADLDETIDGRGGNDTLTGGGGDDTFVFAAGHGSDTITDFADGEDRIDLTAFTGITGFGDLAVTDAGGNVIIDLSSQTGGGVIKLENFDSANLDESDFVFYETPSDGG